MSKVVSDFDLSRLNTFGLQAQARFGMVLDDIGDVTQALALARDTGLPFRILGGGSNCILKLRLEAVAGVMNLKGRSIDRSDPQLIRIVAAAGESWPDLVGWSVEQGVGGLENLAGIPGTVGAAPIQNIGAYGVELSDIFDNLTALDSQTGQTVHFDRTDCRFSYRHSRFKEEPGRYVITEVQLALPRPARPVLSYADLRDLPSTTSPRAIMDRVLAVRGAKLPDWRLTGNAGSFFKNPIVVSAKAQTLPDMPLHPVPEGVKLSAGWLLDACGMKGRQIGGAAFSPAHALVMINCGSASYDDVARLTALAVQTVQDRFGVMLEQEPVIY